MMGMLLPLGIEKAAKAHAWLLSQMPTFVTDWWPGSQWKVPVAKIAVEMGFKWRVANYCDVDSRGIGFSSFFLPPAKLGAGSFYLGANFDGDGQLLRGESNYLLHVPANVPVSEFWSVTVYDAETSALFLNLSTLTGRLISTSVQKHPPPGKRTGSRLPRAKIGCHGPDSMAQKRRSSTKAGRCRISNG
jgi:hypothetical protein